MIRKYLFNRNRPAEPQPTTPVQSPLPNEFGSIAQQLQQTLQQLVAQPNRLQIRCAIREGVLLVLIEHLLHVEPDSQQIFLETEQIVRSHTPKLLELDPDCSPTAHSRPIPVRLYLRIAGYQQPYDTRSFTLSPFPSAVPPEDTPIAAQSPAPEPPIVSVEPEIFVSELASTESPLAANNELTNAESVANEMIEARLTDSALSDSIEEVADVEESIEPDIVSLEPDSLPQSTEPFFDHVEESSEESNLEEELHDHQADVPVFSDTNSLENITPSVDLIPYEEFDNNVEVESEESDPLFLETIVEEYENPEIREDELVIQSYSQDVQDFSEIDVDSAEIDPEVSKEFSEEINQASEEINQASLLDRETSESSAEEIEYQIEESIAEEILIEEAAADEQVEDIGVQVSIAPVEQVEVEQFAPEQVPEQVPEPLSPELPIDRSPALEQVRLDQSDSEQIRLDQRDLEQPGLEQPHLEQPHQTDSAELDSAEVVGLGSVELAQSAELDPVAIELNQANPVDPVELDPVELDPVGLDSVDPDSVDPVEVANLNQTDDDTVEVSEAFSNESFNQNFNHSFNSDLVNPAENDHSLNGHSLNHDWVNRDRAQTVDPDQPTAIEETLEPSEEIEQDQGNGRLPSLLSPVNATSTTNTANATNTNTAKPTTASSLDRLPLGIEDEAKRPFRLKLTLSNVLLTGSIGLFFGVSGFYVLSRPCVLGQQCVPLQQSQQLTQRALATIQTNPSALEVVDAYDQLAQANQLLETIPFWSRSHSSAQALMADYASEREELGMVVKALNQANTATKKSSNPPHPMQVWREVQWMWREAIALLEKVPSGSSVYALAQNKRSEYEANLTSINNRVIVEQGAQDRIAAIKKAAEVTEARSQIVNSIESWQQTSQSWQTILDQLEQIPQGTMAYAEAQRLARVYQLRLEGSEKRRSQEERSSSAYNQALTLADQARRFEQQEQWLQATDAWREAIMTIKQVPEGTTHYSQAQTLLNPYTTALNQAELSSKRSTLLRTATPQLENLCLSRLGLCTYTLTTEAIRVQLTARYDQTVEQALRTAQLGGSDALWNDGGSQTGQFLRSLASISESTQTSIELYNADGSRFGTYDPTQSGYIVP